MHMKGKFIDAGGVRTHYYDVGTGPTVVLMHGASVAVDAWCTWRLAIDALSRNHRVVAFDQIGFGRTDMPADGRYVNRVARTVHAFAFLDAMGIDRAVLVGHSEGGFMAAYMAIRRPSLASGIVIVTSGATAPRLGGHLDDGWIAASKSAYDYSGGVDTENDFIRTNASLSSSNDPEAEALLRENYRRAQASGQIEMFRNMPESDTNLDGYIGIQEREIHPHLSSIKAPILLIWAAKDPTVPIERGVALQRIAEHADLYVLGGASHMVMFDRAEAFNRMLMSWCANLN
jgi:pimeloyl-ACP methyl ester carboxylesterase